MLLAALCGCPSESDKRKSTEVLPFADVEVRIGVPAEMGIRTSWEGMLNEWSAQTGAKFSLTEYLGGETSEAVDPFSGPESQSLAILPLDRIPELLAKGDLAPIPDSLLEVEEGVNWRDLFAGLREKVAARKGQPLFVPLAAPVLVCYFRTDLLRAAGLAPPQTWDEYQQLLDKLENWAPGLSAVEPWSESFRATTFLARAVSHAQHPGHYSLFFDIDTGEPLIDGPGFVRALESARSALARMPADVFQYEPADCRREMLEGRSALVIAFEFRGARDSAGESPPSERGGEMEIGFVRLPGAREMYNPTRRNWEPPADKGIHQVTLAGFAGFVIAASARNSPRETEASWNALAKVRGHDFVSGFPAALVGLCRESQLATSATFVGPGLEGAEAAAYASAVANSLRDARLVAELPVVGRSEFRKALARALLPALKGSQSPQEALQAAARDWREIVARTGAAKIRDSYRANLGLSPMTARE